MSTDSDCVQVAVRIRPLVKIEIDKGCQKIIEQIENESQVIVRNNYAFTFNYVFGPDDSQEQIYQKAIYGNLQKLFMGYNVTILAYGQTGSGKTHTMGTTFNGVLDENIGIIPRVTYDIFQEVSLMSSDHTFNITCSFMELYQEQLYDLLSTSSREQSIVDIREDGNKGIIIPGLTEIAVTSAKEIIDCLVRGSGGRAVGATAMNTQSSRSHAIFTVTVQRTKINNTNVSTTSKFHLVDLAGSERPKKTKATGDRFKEGVKINQGLLALGNVISALGSGQSSGYVGYRDSKLTRLLQDSLGGNSVTLMIACVSPADYNLDETLNTLRYADRARKIKNKPIINQDPRTAEINRLNAIIEKLKSQLLSKSDSDNINVNDICYAGSNGVKDIDEMQKHMKVIIEKNRNLQQQLQITLNDVTEIEMRATLAESTKEQLQQKLKEVREAIITLNNNQDENKCKEHYEEIKKLLEIVNNIEQDIEKNKEEMADQKASFTQLNSTELQNSEIDHEILLTHEAQQKLDAFTSKQLNFNNELRRINRELCLKEELHQKIIGNLTKFCNYSDSDGADSTELKLREFDAHLKKLEAERDEINEKLNMKVNASSKISEERRKRLQQLELEINELKKKNLQQAKMLKMREKESQKIVNLSKEIQEMKAARVKLIREMKSESERFKQWKMAKEKEVLQLKVKDRKRENEFVKMKVLHDKQRNVLKRKMEEAMAANKRLKGALDKTKCIQSQRKALNSGKIDQILSCIGHEIELMITVIDAEQSLEHFMEDRAILTKRLKEIQELEPKNTQEINSIEEELLIRNVQITDMQQKIQDSNIEDKINSLAESIQNLIEARAVIKRLFTTITEMRREFVVKNSENEDIKTMYETQTEKCVKLENELQELITKQNEEKADIEKNYEEKITILLRELYNVPNLMNGGGGGEITTEMKETMKIQQETLDKYEAIREEYEKLRALYENVQKQLEEVKSLKKPQNKQLTRLNQQIAVELSDTDQTFTEDEEDDISNDPDWVKTPQVRTRHNQTFSKVNGSKRSSDGSIRCGCKQSCMTKVCSCKRNGISCSESCKCSDACLNNKSIKEEQISDSGAEDKENLETNTSDEHTPKKSKLSAELDIDKNIFTPSYPHLKKKRNQPFY